MSQGHAKERDADFSKLDEDQSASAQPEGGTDGGDEKSSSEGSENAQGEDDSSSKVTRKEFEALRAEMVDYQDKYLRALAETENVRKRALKERSEILKYQGERVFLDILEVVDNLERALADKEATLDKFREGVTLIHKLLVDTLTRWEVKGESAIGKNFDPHCHTALSQVPVADKPAGTIIAEMKKPYHYKDKLLRVGEVIVAAAPAKVESAEETKEGE